MKTKNIKVTFSCGISKYQHVEKVDELFREADVKLYMAKNNGKNHIIY